MNKTELIMLPRQVEHQYALERHTVDELVKIYKMLDYSRRNSINYLYRLPDHRYEKAAAFPRRQSLKEKEGNL